MQLQHDFCYETSFICLNYVMIIFPRKLIQFHIIFGKLTSQYLPRLVSNLSLLSACPCQGAMLSTSAAISFFLILTLYFLSLFIPSLISSWSGGEPGIICHSIHSWNIPYSFLLPETVFSVLPANFHRTPYFT